MTSFQNDFILDRRQPVHGDVRQQRRRRARRHPRVQLGDVAAVEAVQQRIAQDGFCPPCREALDAGAEQQGGVQHF